MNEESMKRTMCEIGKRVYDRGMVAANDGNFSVRLNAEEFLCTPAGVSKGFMIPEAICKVDAAGNLIEAGKEYRPSSEIKMHLRVYRERPDIHAVVHAHPPYATTFAVAGIPLSRPIIAEAIISLGMVPVAEYGTPSTEEIPDAIAKYVKDYDAMLLANHGALTYAGSLLDAYHKMESVEFYARLLYQSKMLGKARELTPEQVERLCQMK